MTPPARSSRRDIDAFLAKVAAAPKPYPGGRCGRLIFALDATASRQPTWDQACHIQADMFREARTVGGLDIQLCYYRGFGEFEASTWYHDSGALMTRMLQTRCLGGLTQIGSVLQHAISETRRQRINALVFVGDSMEEDIDRISHLAGELGLLGVPVFVFHEGNDPTAARAFAQIARLTGGACCAFDAASARELGELLRAVAIYAAGGRAALTDFSARHGAAVRRLTRQMRPQQGEG